MNKKTILSLFMLSTITYASSSYSATKEQKCDADTILLVAEELGLENIAEDKSNESKIDGVRAAACKISPQNKDLIYVALASNARDNPHIQGELFYDFTIAIVDTKKNNVTASYKGKLEEEATLRIDESTLSIDTANYKLNEQTRAFGVDVRNDYSPSCAEGGFGSARTLYVQEGKKIRPILKDLTLSKWSYLVNPVPLCKAAIESGPETSPIIEQSNISLSMAEPQTNGFKDIIVNIRKKIVDEDGKAVTLNKKERKEILPDNYDLKPYSYKVQYDGKKYPIQN
jgi:hypothetical protein